MTVLALILAILFAGASAVAGFLLGVMGEKGSRR